MRVFVTGATGWVGSAVVKELLGAGHQVIGMARSDEGLKSVGAAGAQPHPGDLENLESLRAGAAAADAVIHTAFIHDFSRYEHVAEIDRRAIETLGAAIAGSDRLLIVTSGMAGLKKGDVLTEDDPTAPQFPRKTELAAEAAAEKGTRVSVVRLPPSVHGEGDKGFVPMLISAARAKSASVYTGDGKNRWPGVHRLDAARLYRLALENGSAGARYHATEDDGVPFRKIAEVIGRRLNVPVQSKTPEQATEYLGWIGMFTGLDLAASSDRTRQALGWEPKQRFLLDDIDQPYYFKG
jgi:nucleoside-diphosphate-sugar epimerase